MAAATQLPEQLIYLIIRFATDIADLPLSISSPSTTTTLSLKQLIRSHLPQDNSSARIRLIYAGKVLPDNAALSTSLRIPPRIPQAAGYDNGGIGSKSKGKQPVRDDASEAKHYYIHCSLGDALSPSELDQEARVAETTEESLRSQLQSTLHGTSSSGNDSGPRRRSSTTTTAAAPPPQGFDRLLTSGFTAQEVAALRSHFQTNLSYTHTPDTMPSAAEMRVLEDRWLDSTATDGPSAATGEGETGWGDGFAVADGGLDDMLWGYLAGFFWPLGALVWGFREEGIWSRRRQLAVATGVVLNAVFGFMRWSQ